MKYRYWLYTVAAVSLLAACDVNDEFDLEESRKVTEIQKGTLALAASDYKKIADDETNRSIALAKDPEGQTGLKALEAVATNKYFTNEATAEEYLPAFLKSTYPTYDDGSRLSVICNYLRSVSPYMNDFASLANYTLESKDYDAVWGDRVQASFLTPTTESKITSLLQEGITNAKVGDMVVVNYAYSETEPSIGGGTAVENVYQQVSSVDAEGGNYVIVAPGKDGELYPFGMLNEGKNYGYMYPTITLPVTDGIIDSEGSSWVINVQPTSKGYALVNPIGKYLYMDGTYNSFNYSDALPETGGDWVFKKNANGTFSIVNVEKNKTVKLNLYNDSYSYGSYPASSFGIYLDETFLGDGGNFVVQDVQLGGALKYVWSNDANYGWKGSAYSSGNQQAESWLVSPEIDLSKANEASLSFEAAINFLNGNNRADFFDVKISEDYAGDVTAATWTSLEGATWSNGSGWSYVESGDVSLADYAGKKIRIAFMYKSTDGCAPTVEVKNLSLTEPVTGYYADVYLFKEIPANEVATMARTSVATTATRAAVAANKSALYRYDGTDWSAYTCSDAKVCVWQPSDYATLGAEFIQKPTSVLPTYLSERYPYANAGQKAVVVYYKTASAYAADEYEYKNSVWSLLGTTEKRTVSLAMENGEWTARSSEYYSNSLKGDEGGFTISNVYMDNALSYIWINDAVYGWKASGYKSGNKNTEAWVVSSAIDLSEATKPIATFEEAINYVNGGDVNDYCTVEVTEEFDGEDASASEWEPLEIPVRADGASWTYVNVGNIDLSAYAGKVIYLGFHYKSETAVATTWEFKELVVKEDE